MARQWSDPLHDLVDAKHIDHIRTCHLSSPQEFNDNPDICHAFWLALRDAERLTMEGKIFIPIFPSDKRRLMIFETGMPGDGTCERIERDYLPFFLRVGYHGLVLRHLGTWIDADERAGQDPMISCPERVKIGHDHGEKTLGEQEIYTIDNIAREVGSAINALGESMDEIVLIGHSSGALADIWSIPDIASHIQKRITHIVSIAGLTGGIENLTFLKRFWLKTHLKQCRDYINLADPVTNIERLQNMFQRVYTETLPDNIMFIQINTPKDEFIHPAAARRYQEHLGRGLNIIDETQTEKRYHYLKNLRGETLLKLLKGYHPDARRTVTFSRIQPRDP